MIYTISLIIKIDYMYYLFIYNDKHRNNNQSLYQLINKILLGKSCNQRTNRSFTIFQFSVKNLT